MLDAYRHPGRVTVADTQVEDFVQAQPTRIARHQHGAMFEVRGVGDQVPDLRATQERREFAWLAWGGNAKRGAIALQRRVIQKAQRVDRDVARTPRPLTITNQVQQVGLHLLVGNLIG